MSALLISVILFVYRYRLVFVGSDVYRINTLSGHFCKYPCETPQPQVLPTQGPTATPFNWQAYVATLSRGEQATAQRAHRFEQLQALKPMYMSNFGQQMEVGTFQLHMQFHQVLEAADGSLYVVAESCVFVGPGGCSRYHLGILNGAGFMEIWLPHENGEWQQMEMLDTSTPQGIVVRTTLRGETQPHQYRVTRRDIVQTAVTNDGAIENTIDKHLHDGDTCRVDHSLASPTFINAIDARGRRRPLVSKADFLKATQQIIELSDPDIVYCTHFQDVDLLVAGFGDIRVTFVVSPNELWLGSTAEPFAITPHHLVLLTGVNDANGYPTGDTFAYADVTRKKPFP